MKVIRAEHLGFCFGVRDAISLAFKTAQSEPLTILGDLVHNDAVLNELRRRGVQIRQAPEEIETPAAMITAHGASERLKNRVRRQGLRLVEATCPLVQVAHRAVERLAREGFHIVVVGKRDHVEVRGLTEDLPAFDIVLSEEDIERIQPHAKIGVAAQTTQPIDRVTRLVDCLRARFPRSEVKFIDTVCQPTKLRQSAAAELAASVEVLVVVGGNHSNNTRELVATGSRHGARVHHVTGPEELRAEWFEGVTVAGLTAGTSTPDAVIDAVQERLETLGPPESELVCAAVEHTSPVAQALPV